MSVAETAQILQLILAPVVMLSACGILVSGLLGHYQAINDRLRTLTRERLELLFGGATPDRIAHERLEEIDVQLPALLRRHLQVRNAVLLFYTAIAIFTGCMLAIAMAILTGAAILAVGVLLLFLGGVVLLLLAALSSALEIRMSHEAVRYEVDRVAGLKRDGSRGT